ncbi:nuclear pore complex protein NUP35-like [Phoenix dactylifera]|uniref:Nuclear pore complex protein NUP35 n=1 Tax=Phoenix dactylifera TaxID=42345 RepID=A0A8B9ALL1_PHODC|nr:nuclear pore complex protein NUP35-like [Phoenix dactylifera]
MSSSPLPRSSKPGRQSPFFRDLASPISAHRGGRFATPGPAAAVSALWRENFSASDCPPPPVFTLDDRADFLPEPALAELPPPSPASRSGTRSRTPPPLARGGSGSFSRSPSLSSPSGLRIRAEVNDSEGKQAALQSPEISSWTHGLRVGGGGQGETGTGSPVTGVVEPGALLMLPPPREVARPEVQKSSSVPNGGLNEEEWVTVFGFSPGDTNFVLREFEKCGPVLKHVPGPRDANWMHILFQNPYDARKALGKNGTQINSVLMIGVKPVDPMQRQFLTEKLNNINHGGFMVSLPSKLPGTRSSAAPSSSGALPHSYHRKTSTNAITDSGRHSTGTIASPAKSIVSKVMDLMFGI